MILARKLYWIAFALFISTSAVTLAQDATCPIIVRTALAATDEACAGTGRNQACYGNINLLAEPQPGIEDFSFTEPGDLVNVAGVQTLTLSPLNQEADIWGVALLKLQANLPDTLPGQNVTFLLFGDVEIENAVSSNVEEADIVETSGDVTLDVTINTMTPLLESLTGGTAMPKMLNAGTKATADGYFQLADMIHVQLEDGTEGWIPNMMVTLSGDVSTLPPLDPTGLLTQASGIQATPEPQFAPMQAFYFKTGANDAPCEEAPDSGILIQTPEGAGKIELVVNDAKVTLGSTGYFQAQPGGEMTISVVEGEGTVEAEGRLVTIPAGSRARVPVDENLSASGTPVGPEPYDPADLTALPVKILPETIAIAPALVIADTGEGIMPRPGTWTSVTNTPVAGAGCPPMLNQAFNTFGTGNATDFTMPEGAFDLQRVMETNSTEMDMIGSITYSNPEVNLYFMDIADEGTILHYEFRLISETQIDQFFVIETEGCRITVSGVMTAKG